MRSSCGSIAQTVCLAEIFREEEHRNFRTPGRKRIRIGNTHLDLSGLQCFNSHLSSLVSYVSIASIHTLHLRVSPNIIVPVTPASSVNILGGSSDGISL